MKVTCPACGRVSQAKTEMLGRRVKCKCSHVFMIPAAPPSNPPADLVAEIVEVPPQAPPAGFQRSAPLPAKRVFRTSAESKILSVGIVGLMGVVFLLACVSIFFLLDENYQYKGRNLLVTAGFALLFAIWFIWAAIDSALYRIEVSGNAIIANSMLAKRKIVISNVAYVECNNGMSYRFRDRNGNELGVVTSFFRGLGEFDRWVKERFEHAPYGTQY